MSANNSNKFNRASKSKETENLPILKLVKPANSSNSPSYQQFDRPVILQQSPTLSANFIAANFIILTYRHHRSDRLDVYCQNRASYPRNREARTNGNGERSTISR